MTSTMTKNNNIIIYYGYIGNYIQNYIIYKLMLFPTELNTTKFMIDI